MPTQTAPASTIVMVPRGSRNTDMPIISADSSSTPNSPRAEVTDNGVGIESCCRDGFDQAESRPSGSADGRMPRMTPPRRPKVHRGVPNRHPPTDEATVEASYPGATPPVVQRPGSSRRQW